MSEVDKMNGDVPDEKNENSAPPVPPVISATSTPSVTSPPSATSPPSVVPSASSQRKPRINRRSFHLANNPLVDLLAEKKPAQLNSDINGCNDGTETKKEDASSKRIISLSSTKSSSGESSSKIDSSKGRKIISLKKSLNTEKGEKAADNEPSSSADPPPKKKHKPITWP